MPVCAYIGVTFVPGGHGSLLGLINAFIHIILYTYYYLASLGPEVQKYLWWKKYVTKLQLVQFIIILFHNLQAIPRDCAYPKTFNVLLVIQAGYFTYLFGSFYIRAYIEKKPQETIIKVSSKKKVEENGNTILANGYKANGSISNGNIANGSICNGTVVANGSCNSHISNGTTPNALDKKDTFNEAIYIEKTKYD